MYALPTAHTASDLECALPCVPPTQGALPHARPHGILQFSILHFCSTYDIAHVIY